MASATKDSVTLQQGISSSAGTLVEDESLKRNTDCVYFLASPLTCKKGSECEYRHSEYARMNPRDCYYWLNGNCLNPKCSFRHPPLDGLMGPQAGNFPGPPSVSSATPISDKQAVPCIFFQKGYCLKGDKCPFSHGPSLLSIKTQQIPATETRTFKKAFGALEKCKTQPKMNIQANASGPVVAPPHVNAIPKVETTIPPPSGLIEEPPKYRESNGALDNGNLKSRTTYAHHASSLDDLNFPNGKDGDDSLRESSPGFDVLVDDKLSDDEYYHGEDQYMRVRGHDVRNHNEFEMGRRDDYDPEIRHDRRGYDSYDHLQERYTLEHRRIPSERSHGEPGHYDRRGRYKSESPDLIENSDLRNRLSKPRRVNGLRSVVNSDYIPSNHVENQGHWNTRRDRDRSPTHESSLSSRLQGRIKLPRRSSPVSGGYSERENERGRNWGRLTSPSRPHVASNQGRLRDRLRGRIQDDSNEGRNLRGPLIRRDFIQDNGIDFAGPKCLADLKGTKQTDNKQSTSRGKLRDTFLASSLETSGDISFDGPKPLSEILKRKRVADMADYTRGKSDTSANNSLVAEGGKEEGEISNKKIELIDSGKEEGEISNKKIELIDSESSISEVKKDPEIEEGLIGVEGEEHELDEVYDEGDDEYEHEHEHEHEQDDDGEGYDLNEGEIGDHEEDLMDEDDGDDFAKTLGVSF